jgi:DNA repair exonuclease SbcCD nuclease subunit
MPAFRFLHASDFHLERPPAGLAEIADHLREPLIEAPYRAARNVVEAALLHDADFVLLAGDIVWPRRSGPRGVLFLREQFTRLAERNIDVYWVGGRVDRVHEWPAEIAWPANVHIFPVDRPLRISVTKRGQPLCDIVGQSLPGDREIDIADFCAALISPGERFNIGLAHGDFEAGELRTIHPPAEPEALLRNNSKRFNYWALGGEHEPTLPDESRPLVHYPGSPQGRSPAEPGPHGCTLVQVTQEHEIRTTPIITDAVRYCNEPVTLPSGTSSAASNELERILRQRLESLVNANSGVTLLVKFTLDSDSLSMDERSWLPLPAITGVLRGEFGYRTPPVWLDRIQLPPPCLPPEDLYQQESILGDFLQTARRHQRSGEPIDLCCYLPAGKWHEPLSQALRLDVAACTGATVQEAAALGAGLLFPEEAPRR